MTSYNTSAYKLSELPPDLFKEIVKDGDDTVTVYALKHFNTNPSLFDRIKAGLGFDIEHVRYRVTLWNNDRIIAFTDVEPDIWDKKDTKIIRSVIDKLMKAKEK